MTIYCTTTGAYATLQELNSGGTWPLDSNITDEQLARYGGARVATAPRPPATREETIDTVTRILIVP